jgi:formamidase
MLHAIWCFSLPSSKASRDDAYSLMSVAADFSVTQVVDGRQGIHCKIPRSVFPPKKKPRL